MLTITRARLSHLAAGMAESCRGYRIRDAANCCGMMLRCVCKVYNMIMVVASWSAALLSIVVTTVFIAPLAGAVLFLVGLCQDELFYPSIQAILRELFNMQEAHANSPLTNYISIANNTNATLLCEAQWDMARGGLYMLAGTPLVILAQVIMLTSYHVVASVSWRHMKDQGRHERGEEKGDRTEMMRKGSDKYNSQVDQEGGQYGLSPPNFGGGPGSPSWASGGSRGAAPDLGAWGRQPTGNVSTNI